MSLFGGKKKKLFVSCARNGEGELKKEVEELFGGREERRWEVKEEKGKKGVVELDWRGREGEGGEREEEEFRRSSYKLVYTSFLSSRVLLFLSSFSFLNSKHFYLQIKQLYPSLLLPLLPPHSSFSFHTTGENQHFTNTLYASQLSKDAVCDASREVNAGKRPSVDLKDAK